jgi:molybdenum cofactor cytidylyltransferase
MTKLAAIVLAAGASTRFGAENKLLARLDDGRPIIRCVIEALSGGGIADIIVVTGYDATQITEALGGLPVRFVENDRWQTGMGSSVATGVRALGEDVAGALIVPGDMPHLSAELLHSLGVVFDNHDQMSVVYPALPDGSQRNPVLWPRSFFPQLAVLIGPSGGKSLLQDLTDRSVPVTVDDSMLLADVDTPADRDAREDCPDSQRS